MVEPMAAEGVSVIICPVYRSGQHCLATNRQEACIRLIYAGLVLVPRRAKAPAAQRPRNLGLLAIVAVQREARNAEIPAHEAPPVLVGWRVAARPMNGHHSHGSYDEGEERTNDQAPVTGHGTV